MDGTPARHAEQDSVYRVVRRWEQAVRYRYGSAVRCLTAYYQESPTGRYHRYIYLHISPISPRRSTLVNLDDSGHLTYCQLVRNLAAYSRYIAREHDNDDEPGEGPYNTVNMSLSNGDPEIINPDQTNTYRKTPSQPPPPVLPENATSTDTRPPANRRKDKLSERLYIDVTENCLNWSQTVSKYYNWPHASKAYHAIKQGMVEEMDEDIHLLVIKGATGIGKTSPRHSTKSGPSMVRPWLSRSQMVGRIRLRTYRTL